MRGQREQPLKDSQKFRNRPRGAPFSVPAMALVLHRIIASSSSPLGEAPHLQRWISRKGHREEACPAFLASRRAQSRRAGRKGVRRSGVCCRRGRGRLQGQGCGRREIKVLCTAKPSLAPLTRPETKEDEHKCWLLQLMDVYGQQRYQAITEQRWALLDLLQRTSNSYC